MKNSIKIVLIILLSILIIVMGWAPWLDAEDVRAIVKTYPNFQMQHSPGSGQENPEIWITWLPFCRWATTYEGGWFVCFWQAK